MGKVSPDRWQLIRSHLEAALELPPSEVTAFLDHLDAVEPGLRQELRSLLDAHRAAELFLSRPAVSLVASEGNQAESGLTVGSYRLLHELGRGGMGTVYLAERADDAYRRQVAVKVLQRGLDTPELVSRFERERRILAALDHAHIARLLDGGSTEQGRPYLVMERVDGLHIDVHCEKSTLSLERRLELFAKVCGAVHYAHQHGVVHGDLKPANIIVTAQDEPKLLDFGVARLSRSMDRARPSAGSGDGPADRGVIEVERPPLTPDYASPEQLLGEPITTASDVYALGIVLFQLVAGTRPFEPLGDIRVLDRDALLQVLSRRRPPWVPGLYRADSCGGSATQGLFGKAKRARITLTDLANIVQRALAAEPSERFPTAGDLAAELRRLLVGAPVESTPPTLRYLVQKQIDRHRALVAVGGSALLALSAFVATSLHQQWKMAQRATLAQRFAQQAQQIEAIARLAVLLPAPTARHQEVRLRHRLARIEREVASLGPDAVGPAAYALGVGSYALADYARAQKHFEQAWEDGFRTPPVASALGNTLGARFRQAIQEAERIASPELRREARRAATKTFRDPAVGYLQLARRDDPRYATLLDASLAFYDGRLEDAATKARSAFALFPWLHEAKKLEGDVYREQAARARDKTDLGAATVWYEKAGEAYRQAMALARSDARLFLAECSRRGALSELVHVTGELDPRRFSEALEVCDQALALQPDLADAFVEKSRLFLERARGRLISASDPDPDFAEAERLARAAIYRDRSNAGAYLQLGHVLVDVASRREDLGVDPQPTYRQAEDAMLLATTLNPSRPEAFNGLGTLRWYHAHYLYRQGGDFTAELHAASEAFRRALGLVPRYSRAYNNIGACQLDEAVFRAAAGEDSTPAFIAATESFRQATEITPDNPVFLTNLGNAHLELALHLHRQGGDADRQIAAATDVYQRALGLGSGLANPWFNLALAEKLRGYLRLSAGLDPRSSLERALCALDEAISLNPGMVSGHVQRGTALLLLARWRVSEGERPVALLAEVEAALNEALRLAPADPQALATRGELAWRRACWLPRAAPGLQAGRADVEAALEAYADYPYALAVRGALELMEAKRSSGSKRRELAAAAARSLERAVELDRYLDAELAALLPEAQTLAGAGDLEPLPP